MISDFGAYRIYLPVLHTIKDQRIPTSLRCKDFIEKKDFIRTKHVFTLRKILKGMVIGPTDKNLNELWAICTNIPKDPILYQKAWDKLYCTATGYKPIRIDKYSAKTAKDKESI